MGCNFLLAYQKKPNLGVPGNRVTLKPSPTQKIGFSPPPAHSRPFLLKIIL